MLTLSQLKVSLPVKSQPVVSMRLRPLKPERHDIVDQAHPERPDCEATLVLTRRLSRTVAQTQRGASRQTYLTVLVREPSPGYAEGCSLTASNPPAQPPSNVGNWASKAKA